MYINVRKILLTLVACLNIFLCSTALAYEEITIESGSAWEMAHPKVLYQSDNHEVCELYQKEDGKFCILLVKPGDATIMVWMFEDKKIYQEKFLLHVVGEPVDAKDIIAAMKNSAGNTQGATNVDFPNVFPRGSYQGNIGQVTSSRNINGIVPLNELSNLKLLHWNLTDAQLQECYDAVKPFVATLVGLSREEQMKKIALELREFFDARMEYSTTAPHFLDAYGYLVLKKASCQGAAAATGLCLNMLGFDYEHVNHNKWTHQWCRVNYNGTYWIVDPYGLYCGPEPAPYKHPIGE